MPEPNTTTAGIVLGAGIGLTGTLIGAPVDSLLIGMMAAILVSIWMPAIDNRIKAASAVAFSTMLAGYGSQVAAGWLAVNHAGLADADPLRLLLALLIGGAAPAAIPTAAARLQSILRGGSAS